MGVVKEGGVAVALAVIAAWVSSRFAGVDVPLEVQASAAVVVSGVGRLLFK